MNLIANKSTVLTFFIVAIVFYIPIFTGIIETTLFLYKPVSVKKPWQRILSLVSSAVLIITHTVGFINSLLSVSASPLSIFYAILFGVLLVGTIMNYYFVYHKIDLTKDESVWEILAKISNSLQIISVVITSLILILAIVFFDRFHENLFAIANRSSKIGSLK